MKRITTLLFVFVTLCTYSWAQMWDRGPQSRVETKTLYSEVLGTERAYNVFLPKSYEVETDRTYPILYLLHGMLGSNTDWTDRGHLKDVMDQLTASGEACEMIIVTPNAGGNIYEGVWNGYFDMPGWKYETFFYTEFLPHIEKTYRVKGDKQHRAIAGLSMGGGGTTSYAQRYPDYYCAAYAMSALMDLPEPTRSGDDKMSMLTRSVIDHSCVRYVQEADEARIAALRSVSWYVDCGDDDFLLDCNIDLTRAMRKAKIPCEFRIRDGAHTWEYWHSALYTCLPFVTRQFAK